MKELKEIASNYQMGFISPTEFLMQVKDFLHFAGAEKCLTDKMDESLLPLADFMCGILTSSNKDYKRIEDFNIKDHEG